MARSKLQLELGKGELYAFSASSLWSLFPIITTLTFSGVTPLWSAALSTMVAAVFFAGVLTIKKQWNELSVQKAWRPIALHTVIIGIVMYSLYFLGINNSSSANAAILAQTEVFFAFIVLTIFMKHETITKRQVSGAICISLGACIVLIPELSSWKWGGFLIVLAKVLAPFGNRYSQMARRLVSAQTIMFLRSIISCIFLCLIAYTFEGNTSLAAVQTSFPFILMNGLLLMGFSKILWINGMNYTAITKGNAIASMSPVLTMIFAYIILGDIPQPLQLAGLPIVILGVLLLTTRKKVS